MKYIYSAFFVAVFCMSALAQQSATITGTVTLNGQPSAGAVVKINVASLPLKVLTTTTDANGVYRFENLTPGDYQIWAEKRDAPSAPGLDGAGLGGAFSATSVKAGQTKTIDLTLTLDVYRSDISVREYVTIAADTNQVAEQVSKTVGSIDAQEMRDRADFSLVDSLRTIPGFRVQQLGGFGRTAGIKTRGLRNQDTAVLIDGIRFRDASSITGDASAFLSDFTLTSVSKIEVLRGAGSSLYGTNAIGGAVDFQTPVPNVPGWHGNLSGAFGGLGLGRFRGNISRGMLDDKIGFNAGFSRTAYTKGVDGDDRADNTNLQTRIEFKPTSTTTFSGRIFFSDAYVKLNNSPDTLGTLPSTATVIEAIPNVNFIADANDPDNRQRSKFFSGQFVVNHAFSPGLMFQGYYSGVRTSRLNTNGPRGTGFQPFSGDESYRFDGHIHTFSGRLDWSAKGNMLTVGFEHERERFGNDGEFVTPANNFSLNARQSSNTIFVQDLVGFFERRLQFSGAFRAQWFALERPTFSSASFPNRFNSVTEPPASYTGDGSVSYYFANTRTKIRSHIGNGYRVPSLYERFGSYFFLGAFFGLGNPELKPERSLAADFGIDQSFFGNRLKLSATYFYNEIRDEIAYLPTDDFGAPSYFNADRHFSRGAEFTISAEPTKSTDIVATYAIVNSDLRAFRRLTSLPPATLASTDRRSYGVPVHQFTIVATQRFKDFWINADLLATSDYLAPIFSNSTFGTYVYRFDGNRRADLTAGYAFRLREGKLNFRLFGTIENLFDNEYYENGFRTVGRNGRVGLSFGF